MITHRIYVEGEGEVAFVLQLIQHLADGSLKAENQKEMKNASLKREDPSLTELSIQILAMGGSDPDTLKENFIKMKDDIAAGTTPLLILDADSDAPGHQPAGGFETRARYCEAKKKEHKIEAMRFFIMPGGSDGNLETLLDKAVSPKGKPTYDCVKSHFDCLCTIPEESRPKMIRHFCEKANKETGGTDFKPEHIHKQMFERYVYVMLYEGKSPKTSLTQRDYKDPDIWDLEAEALDPLKSFFRENISM